MSQGPHNEDYPNFVEEQMKEFATKLQEYGNNIYEWYPKRYDTESAESVKSSLLEALASQLSF